jgi:hypothetical protein
MMLAKFLFALAGAAFYVLWGLGAVALWRAYPAPVLVLALVLYLPVATFVLFLAGMAAERGRQSGNVPELSAFLVRVLEPFAALHNMANNVLTMSLVCLDPPREAATTKRMNRYADGPDGWRKTFAVFVRTQLLDWADPDGVHR